MKTLQTKRLELGAFLQSDLETLREMAGHRKIYETTIAIPHPYTLEHAQAWIDGQYVDTKTHIFAMRLKENGKLMGCIDSRFNEVNSSACLGYWVGLPYWGQGFCTEAARAVIRFSFEELKANRVWANYLSTNLASSRVMEKCNMKFEGTLRQSLQRGNAFFDMSYRAVLREEWLKSS